MLRQTGENYVSSQYAKALFLAEGKVGKTSFLTASLLGVLPWQKTGGVVSRPEHLHILAFDSSALGGLAKFLTKTCGADLAVLKYNVYNFQDDARKVATGEADWDFTLYNQVKTIISEIQAKARSGTHALLISSLTGLCQSVQRGLQGPFAAKKGTGMDQSKWAAFSTAIAELRSHAQLDNIHTLWEAHVYVTPPKNPNEDAKESLQIDGKTGQNFAYNVEQVFRVRRRFGTKHPGSNCDQVYMDTQPNMEVIANGRGFTENLEKVEPDLTVAFKKLGLAVGGYGAKPKVSTPAKKDVSNG
jgi:hypothetical protein